MASPCSICGYPERLLYGPTSPRIPWLELCPINNWAAQLLQCPSCAQIWMRLEYEPWGGYPYCVPWPWDETTWKQRADPGGPQGRNHFRLNYWHIARIFEVLDAATPEWHAKYLSEGVTEGCIRRFRAGVTADFVLHGEGELAYEDIVAR